MPFVKQNILHILHIFPVKSSTLSVNTLQIDSVLLLNLSRVPFLYRCRTGYYAILGFTGEMVDCNNESVPLDTLYNHHWLMKPVSGLTTHYNTPCPPNEIVLPSLNEYGDFTYVFGVGAEVMRMFIIY